LRFTDAAGRKLSLAAYRGAGLVVNIWATWCGPCVAEFPTLAAAAPALAASKILVLPISIDFEGLKAVKPFYDTHGISTLPILLDPDGSATDVLNANGVPITIIINPAGQMVGQAEGAANWNTPRALRMLRHLAGQAPATAINPIQPV
jgi:thiol-disulfide isomerase/thioredoxin